jgi:hypothetical protein
MIPSVGRRVPATASAEGCRAAISAAARHQFNGAPFPATAWAEGRQLNGAPSPCPRVSAMPLPPYFDIGAGVEGLGAGVEVLGAGAEAAGAGAGAGVAGTGVEVLGRGFAAVCIATG